MLESTLFDDRRLLEDIWIAYYTARQNKRNTINALQWEHDLEHNIMQLYREIAERRYVISPSICFIVNRPVKREIFAAHFRDRIVHHYVINKLLPLFENEFIYDTYSCRVGKGTLFGIKRLEHFMRSCTQNFTREAYVLKLDLHGFFMSINRQLLWEKVSGLISRKYKEYDKQVLLYLSYKIIMHNPVEGCRRKGSLSDWDDLPHNKSLFYAPKGFGLPIGNITSQLFANYYLSDFDRYMKETLRLAYYGRYVDDFFVLHRDKELLKAIIPQLREYLMETVGVTVHPRKIYLQPCRRGVSFLGAYIQPQGRFFTRRIIHNVYQYFERFYNRYNFAALDYYGIKTAESALNSYMGLRDHYAEYGRYALIMKSHTC